VACAASSLAAPQIVRVDLMNTPPPGMFLVGNKLMAVCQKCGNVVRIDKPIFGSLHVCARK
jgi:hypothetical protein